MLFFVTDSPHSGGPYWNLHGQQDRQPGLPLYPYGGARNQNGSMTHLRLSLAIGLAYGALLGQGLPSTRRARVLLKKLVRHHSSSYPAANPHFRSLEKPVHSTSKFIFRSFSAILTHFSLRSSLQPQNRLLAFNRETLLWQPLNKPRRTA